MRSCVGEVAPGGARAPAAAHEEDEDGEDGHAERGRPSTSASTRPATSSGPAPASAPPASRLARFGEYLATPAIWAGAHRLAVLNVQGERVERVQAQHVGIGEAAGGRERLEQVVGAVAGLQDGGEGVELGSVPRTRLQVGDDRGRGRRRAALQSGRVGCVGLRGLDRLQRGARVLVVDEHRRRGDHVGQHEERERDGDAQDPAPDGQPGSRQCRVVVDSTCSV